MKKAAVVLSLMGVLAISSQAYMYELTPTVGGVIPEGNLDLDDALSYGLRLGVNVDDYFFDQIEAGIEHAPEVGVENTNLDVDVTRFFVNIVKEYEVASKTSIYGLVGVGYERFSRELADNENDGFGNYGVGVKYALTEALNLKVEARHAVTFDGDNNFLYTLGLSFPFGSHTPKAAPIEVTPYVEPEPTPAPAPAPDFDGDGVADGYDKCPNTPKGAQVDAYGCEIDSDKDGVVDSKDECPNTPKGVAVDEVGCAQTITLRVMFGFDEATIKPEFMEKIEEVATFMKTHEQFNVKLEGHTDSKGSEAYNQKLSIQRANAVAKTLMSFGIDLKRISAEGFGEGNPIATNETDEGRALNRRVEAKFRD
jgi:OOP family OmpA-OmpF porin